MTSKTALIFAALLTAVSIAPAGAESLAENEITEQLLVCDEVVDLTRRLTCFNAIVDKLKVVPNKPVAKAQAKSVSAATEQTTSVPAVKVPSEPVPAAKAPVVVPSAPTEIDDFGNEDIVAKELKKEEKEEKSSAVDNVQATVVRSWRNHDGRFSVELDNGQIWRETQGTRARLPKKGVAVTIKTGRVGGYRMKFENINQLAWVRRTK